MGLLTHPAHAAAQPGRAALIEDFAIELDTALLHRQQACNLCQQQRFAATAGAPQRHMLARRHAQGQGSQPALRTGCLHHQIDNTQLNRLAKRCALIFQQHSCPTMATD